MSRLTESARGQSCAMRIPGVCTNETESVVWCHVRNKRLGGAGMKPPDLPGFYACRACHDEFDGRTRVHERVMVRAWALDAVCETMDRLTRAGLVKM